VGFAVRSVAEEGSKRKPAERRCEELAALTRTRMLSVAR